MNFKSFNKNWLNPLLVVRCLIECRRERRRHEKDTRERAKHQFRKGTKLIGK